jgi:hypothetical protein
MSAECAPRRAAQVRPDAALLASPIRANMPIAIWGAAPCLQINVDDAACDPDHQRRRPVNPLAHATVCYDVTLESLLRPIRAWQPLDNTVVVPPTPK